MLCHTFCGFNRGKPFRLVFLAAVAACMMTLAFHRSTTISLIKKRFVDDSDSLESYEALQYTALSINHSNPLTILMWNLPNGNKFPPIFEHCGPCSISTDRKMAARSHAVVIDFNDIDELPSPGTRREEQIYVWMCRESSWTTKYLHNIKLPATFDDYFNATMTYRRDSQLYFPYLALLHSHQTFDHPGHFIEFLNNDVDSIINNKNSLALWVVHNCDHTFGAKYRFNYVMGLVKAGFDIDVFGKCFGNQGRFPPFRSPQSFALMSAYKFYIAFENAYHCRDYITEKFWENAIYSGAVPIVWGPSAQDLKTHAPPNSYINAEEFGNDTAKLVRYVTFLDKNPTEYRKFFRWRQDLKKIDKLLTLKKINPFSFPKELFANLTAGFSNYWMFLKNRPLGFCDLCHAMHTGRTKTFRPIKSMDQWWYGSERPVCLEGFNDANKNKK